MQYFINVRYDSSAVYAYIEVTNHCQMLRSPDTCECYSSERGLGIHGFRSTRPCLIVEVHVIRAKFHQSFCYCTVFICDFTFHATNVFGCFHGVIAQFEFLKHKFLNLTSLHVHLCSFHIIHEVKQCATCQRINYRDTTDHSGCIPQLELLQSRDIRFAN